MDYSAIYPELILALFAIAVPAVNILVKDSRFLAGFSLAGVGLSMLAVVMHFVEGTGRVVFDTGLLVLDDFSGLFMLVFLTVAFLVILASIRYIEDERHKAEYYSLILLATVGMMLVAASTDLFVLYIGIEITSLSSYALVAFRKKDIKGAEAATKYFIFGGISSAFTLFGISLVYGLTGTTSFQEVGVLVGTLDGYREMLWLALVMVMVGFGFKVAMVPFHSWAPDVYEGAPTTITAMLAAGSKKMGFVAMFKFFLIGMLAIKADWDVVVAILSIVTMTLGNLAALNQTSIKRMLAYSSIAQAGYILMALPVGTEYAVTGGIFHILTHAFMKGGAFIAVATLATVAIGDRISDYKGLAKRSNFMAFSITILLFSLAGIPPLAGFASKVVLFSSPIMGTVAGSEWMVWLAVAGIINSAISLYYYARVVKYMYVDELDEGAPSERLKLPKGMAAAVAICVLAVIGIGVFPEYFIQLCQNAAQALFA
ncbi:MAG TPA: NADH-quinone oxidoreductase subunit N [Methanomassiliicoccales archaeon]|nr:NADH-quinone oxidoreductase subunit N [Euryarchaeota archaeon]HOE52241.1 NADH-quinone oxidoreductase subunit N [Methanomassiliicoccales archaeon]HQM66685.1 NADH-quinone oxidoreductase subunit N [Methanomassiliicoccales archaeon]HRR66769.1 NADH-quinone oxidoreductase subunit N [Methanomassiliicoccales archaeon]